MSVAKENLERIDLIRERVEQMRSGSTWQYTWYVNDVQYLLGRLAEHGDYVGIDGSYRA